VFNELTKAINKLKVKQLFDVVPSQGHISCKNGYQILFCGLDDVEKVKSITPKKSVITDVWIEEATEVAYEDIKQLRKRLRGLA
jgi:phage terminase large subunit